MTPSSHQPRDLLYPDESEHILPEADLGNAPLTQADPGRPRPALEIDWRLTLGGVLIVAGFVALGIGWFGVSGTAQVWKQLPYLASGGIGGGALVALGVLAILSYQHAQDRALIGAVLMRLNALEPSIADEFDVVLRELHSRGGSGGAGVRKNGQRT